MLVTTGPTSAVALAVLILINAVANGSVIALARDATRRQRDADARRAATRARSRSTSTEQVSASAPRRAPVAVPTTRRPVHAPGHALVAPVWRQTTHADVMDAEIISEERFLS